MIVYYYWYAIFNFLEQWHRLSCIAELKMRNEISDRSWPQDHLVFHFLPFIHIYLLPLIILYHDFKSDQWVSGHDETVVTCQWIEVLLSLSRLVDLNFAYYSCRRYKYVTSSCKIYILMWNDVSTQRNCNSRYNYAQP